MNEETNEIRETLSKAHKESKNSNPDPDKILRYCEECEESIARLNPTERIELKRMERFANTLLAKEYWDMATDENDELCSRLLAIELCRIYLVDLAKVPFLALRITETKFEELEQYLEKECSVWGNPERE